jgi:hypothetical protein
MTAHTPGPWTARTYSATKGKVEEVSINSSRWKEMAIVFVQEEGDLLGNGEANARLMAAAPDLLAACERLLMSADASWRGRDVGHDWNAACDEAVAAIAKARGTR